MPLLSAVSAFSRITALASRRPVHAAFSWLHGNPKTIMDWQVELVAIPAPTHGEEARAKWLQQRFLQAGLTGVQIDGAGNVIGILPAAKLPAESTGPVVLLSAHLDTVFPAGTPLHPVFEDDRLVAPGACDNAAGVAGMLAILSALIHAGLELPAPLVVLGNVGEEGEGDLRGVRYLYDHSPLAGRIAAHIVLDGPGADAAVTQALGSRRFQAAISGPGGHSFTDAGIPNPIAALAAALVRLADTPLPEDCCTTLNLGTIAGGISVNSIPESAQAAIDFRSTDPGELLRLEVALHRAIEDAVERANARAKSTPGPRGRLSFTVTKIGDRPAARLPDDSALLAALRAVDRHLGLRTDLRLGSTDANIPLSRGVPALSLGAGGEGGAAHTLREWYQPKDRDLALKRILLLTLAMLEWAAEQ
ncbi:MAG TPA: M20/M25/M40 family metallo-hydrolase [Bryobacteraceae bacterium]|nr:M20/M25/M40 family metallo-hydrolase [Bryobacteraceae bacterium]